MQFLKNISNLLRFQVFLISIFIFSSSNSQILVSGTILDENGEASPYISVGLEGGSIGCVPDEKGYFELEIPQNSTLTIRGLGIAIHRIQNINGSGESVDLGELKMLNLGFAGYAMTRKKKFLIGKEYSECVYIDNHIEPTDDMLKITCQDGSNRFTWTYIEKDRSLQVEYSNIRLCQ